MPPQMIIRPCVAEDFQQISSIYNYYVRETVISLALEESSPAALTQLWQSNPDLPFLVSEQNDTICGYACARPFKPRAGYQHTLESTIYVHPNRQKHGIGRALYQALLNQERVRQAHCLIAGISLPNPASIRLHRSFGFHKVGHLPQVGRKFDRWVDVEYWQKTMNMENPS